MSKEKLCHRCGFVIIDKQGMIISDEYLMSKTHCVMKRYIHHDKLNIIDMDVKLKGIDVLCPACYDMYQTWMHREDFKIFLEESCAGNVK